MATLAEPAGKMVPERNERRLVIALDYGTTFSGLAIATPYGQKCNNLDEITVIQRWNAGMRNTDKVPSRIAYSVDSDGKEDGIGDENWGAAIILQDKVIMVHTKLELDPASVKEELDAISDLLKGINDMNFEYIKKSDEHGIPPFTRRTAEEIVTDYLINMINCADDQLNPGGSRSLISTDIVITVPTAWSERAMNATYRAVTKAGLNNSRFPRLREVMFISESEAAALFTARYIRDKMTGGRDFLKLNESFVVCDAGGGTVDAVSYTVVQTEPTLQLKIVGEPTGERCGSIFVNIAFKEWLRNWIGDDLYFLLDPYMDENKISSHSIESPAMAELMKKFDVLKELYGKSFKKNQGIDLPGPDIIRNLTIPGMVESGEILISSPLMESFFKKSVTGTIRLIDHHLKEIEKLGPGFRSENVFLVGGFGSSKYLRDQVQRFLGSRGLQMRVPEKQSWTAIVQGAVLCGVEKRTTQNLIRATHCKHHYGIAPNPLFVEHLHSKEDRFVDTATGEILAHGRMLWILNKGDVILSTKPLLREEELLLDFGKRQVKKKSIVVYQYSRDDKPRPTRYWAARGELPVACKLELDLTNIQKKEWLSVGRVMSLKVIFRMDIAEDRVSASVWRNGEMLANASMPHEEKPLPMPILG